MLRFCVTIARHLVPTSPTLGSLFSGLPLYSSAASRPSTVDCAPPGHTNPRVLVPTSMLTYLQSFPHLRDAPLTPIIPAHTRPPGWGSPVQPTSAPSSSVPLPPQPPLLPFPPFIAHSQSCHPTFTHPSPSLVTMFPSQGSYSHTMPITIRTPTVHFYQCDPPREIRS